MYFFENSNLLQLKIISNHIVGSLHAFDGTNEAGRLEKHGGNKRPERMTLKKKNDGEKWNK